MQKMHHRPEPTKWLRWVVLALGLFAIFLLIRWALPTHDLESQTPSRVFSSVKTPPSPPQVQFDFYTVLPKMAVVSPPLPPEEAMTKEER